MARLNAVGACVLLLAVASCSKVSGPQPLTQESTSPVPANPRPASPSASFADPAVNTAPRQAAQAPFAAAPGDPPPAPAPAPAPALRPHPATVAKEAAMKIYPALGVKDSLFNKTFRDLYTEKAQQEPEFLTQADWPLLLARRTSELLAPLTASASSPAVLAPAAIPGDHIRAAGIRTVAGIRPDGPSCLRPFIQSGSRAQRSRSRRLSSDPVALLAMEWILLGLLPSHLAGTGPNRGLDGQIQPFGQSSRSRSLQSKPVALLVALDSLLLPVDSRANRNGGPSCP